MCSQMAAMALSPIAAMALPLVQNEGWVQSMREFAIELRHKVRSKLDQDTFQRDVAELDTNMTFMDWTYKVTGVDLTYVWDPELFIKFKEAIWHDQPNLFWNELMDRIDYSESMDACRMDMLACMQDQRRVQKTGKHLPCIPPLQRASSRSRA